MPLPNLLLLLLPPFVTILCLLFFCLVKARAKPELPPGPWQLPFIGSIHHVGLNALTHRSFANLAKKYGPLLHLKLGQVNFIVASSSAAAYEILKTHDQIFASRPTLLAVKTIAYDSIGIGFSPYGVYWRELRKICAQELLSSKKVRSFSSVRDEEAGKLLEQIRMANGLELNMTEMLLGAVNGHITRAAFGSKCGSRERFLAALKETMKLLPLLRPADLFPSLGRVISAVDGSKTRMVKVRREMDAVLDEIVAEHLGKKESEEGEGEAEAEDFVDVLLRVKEKGELPISLGFENVKAVILVIFLFYY